MPLINIGCGSVFHTAWVNIDKNPSDPSVRRWDIQRGLPFKDGDADACYASHVLEHLDRSQAKTLVKECWRILKPSGVIRAVVPDLEGVVKNYLLALDRADCGDEVAKENYDWMMLELYDQTVRSKSGGEMASFLSDSNIKNRRFILSRIGLEAESFWKTTEQTSKSKFMEKLIGKNLSWAVSKARFLIAKTLIRMISGRAGTQAFSEGWLRNSGEIHRWMYDRFSLRRLLSDTGFVDVTACQADQSRIPGFNQYELDIVNGVVRKPDSLYMEGRKPAQAQKDC